MGASQVIYLVESDDLRNLTDCPASTLRYAMMQTMIHLGFAVVRTKGLDDTVKFLKRVHRRILRRSFPTEFASHADGKNGVVGTDSDEGPRPSLPSFGSPISGARRSRESGRGDHLNMANLVFDTPPLPFDSERLRLYTEFKAKIELARESGTRSVRAIFRAMLKQVESYSVTKVHAITSKFETPSSLVNAYSDAMKRGEELERVVEDVSIGSGVRSRRVGPKSSAELGKIFAAGLDSARQREGVVDDEDDGGRVEPVAETLTECKSSESDLSGDPSPTTELFSERKGPERESKKRDRMTERICDVPYSLSHVECDPSDIVGGGSSFSLSRKEEKSAKTNGATASADNAAIPSNEVDNRLKTSIHKSSELITSPSPPLKESTGAGISTRSSHQSSLCDKAECLDLTEDSEDNKRSCRIQGAKVLCKPSGGLSKVCNGGRPHPLFHSDSEYSSSSDSDDYNHDLIVRLQKKSDSVTHESNTVTDRARASVQEQKFQDYPIFSIPKSDLIQGHGSSSSTKCATVKTAACSMEVIEID